MADLRKRKRMVIFVEVQLTEYYIYIALFNDEKESMMFKFSY